jgi:electron transfer flavoprotein beta subunit
VVCGSLVPEPLQILEPVTGPAGPSLKNEMMLPAILDAWAAHAQFEAAHLAKQVAGSRVWLVSMGPKAKLQQVMMTVAQKVPIELVALDGPASGFADSFETAAALAEAIEAIPTLDRASLLVSGGWESASRGSGSTLQMVGERLGITEQFQGVDQLTIRADGRLRSAGAHRRVAGTRFRCVAGLRQSSAGRPVTCPRPRNNPQVGMVNMRTVMPALQRAKAARIANAGMSYGPVSLPRQQRQTRVVKNMPWKRLPAKLSPGSGRNNVETIMLLAHTEPDGTLAEPALEALSAALALGGEVTVGLVGLQAEPTANQSAKSGAGPPWHLRHRERV